MTSGGQASQRSPHHQQKQTPTTARNHQHSNRARAETKTSHAYADRIPAKAVQVSPKTEEAAASKQWALEEEHEARDTTSPRGEQEAARKHNNAAAETKN
jgi:hypothetical protein